MYGLGALVGSITQITFYYGEVQNAQLIESRYGLYLISLLIGILSVVVAAVYCKKNKKA